MKALKTIKNAYSVLAVILIGVGLLLLIRPTITVKTICKVCGFVLALFGIIKLIGYFSKDIFQLAFQFDFAMGCISCIIGCILIFHSKTVMELVAVGIGVFMLTDALLRIQTALDARKFGIRNWWLLLFISLIAAVIGVLLLVMPFKGTIMIIRIIGLNLCIDGILNLLMVQNTVKTYRTIERSNIL